MDCWDGAEWHPAVTAEEDGEEEVESNGGGDVDGYSREDEKPGGTPCLGNAPPKVYY